MGHLAKKINDLMFYSYCKDIITAGFIARLFPAMYS